jgi:hypothetical protein
MLLNENNVNKYNSTGIPKLIFDTAKHQSNVHDVGKNSTSTSNAHSLDFTTASPQEQCDQLLLLLNQAQHSPPKITMLLSKHPLMNRPPLLLQDLCSFGPALLQLRQTKVPAQTLAQPLLLLVQELHQYLKWRLSGT